jgi:hypothetical protein
MLSSTMESMYGESRIMSTERRNTAPATRTRLRSVGVLGAAA